MSSTKPYELAQRLGVFVAADFQRGLDRFYLDVEFVDDAIAKLLSGSRVINQLAKDAKPFEGGATNSSRPVTSFQPDWANALPMPNWVRTSCLPAAADGAYAGAGRRDAQADAEPRLFSSTL